MARLESAPAVRRALCFRAWKLLMCGILVPDQGSNPVSCRRWILTTVQEALSKTLYHNVQMHSQDTRSKEDPAKEFQSSFQKMTVSDYF